MASRHGAISSLRPTSANDWDIVRRVRATVKGGTAMAGRAAMGPRRESRRRRACRREAQSVHGLVVLAEQSSTKRKLPLRSHRRSCSGRTNACPGSKHAFLRTASRPRGMWRAACRLSCAPVRLPDDARAGRRRAAAGQVKHWQAHARPSFETPARPAGRRARPRRQASALWRSSR